MDHQQQIQKLEENKDEEFEYEKDNTEDIYNEDIDYDEEIYQKNWMGY